MIQQEEQKGIETSFSTNDETLVKFYI
jgi:hypothetical protein